MSIKTVSFIFLTMKDEIVIKTIKFFISAPWSLKPTLDAAAAVNNFSKMKTRSGKF